MLKFKDNYIDRAHARSIV